MVMLNVQLENVVVNTDGVVNQRIIVYLLKVVNLNSVNVQRKKLLLPPPPPPLPLNLQPHKL